MATDDDEFEDTILATIGVMFVGALVLAGVGWIINSLGATTFASYVWITAGIIAGIAFLAGIGLIMIS